jgi:hypothetical protein
VFTLCHGRQGSIAVRYLVSIVALLAAFDILATADSIADRNETEANAANAA